VEEAMAEASTEAEEAKKAEEMATTEAILKRLSTTRARK
jgi:hypothetical protein